MRRYLIVLIALVGLAGVACSKSTPSATPGSPAASVAGGGTGNCPDLSGDNPFVIKINNLAFEPSCLTVSGPSSIKIVNMDSVDHTFTIDGTQVDVPISAGQTFNGEPAALTPGTYNFHCTIHPSMTGTITVT